MDGFVGQQARNVRVRPIFRVAGQVCMILKIGEHAGFCFGVKRAVCRAFECAQQQLSCVTLGPLIHNPQEVARLEAAGVRSGGVKFVSCPTCGRTEIDLIGLAQRVEKEVSHIKRDITVAVMGCVVNGPGEAREADVGMAGGKRGGVLFIKGQEPIKVEDNLADELIRVARRLAEEKAAR